MSNLYKVNPHCNYLDTLADFIIARHGNDLSNLKVILPSGNSCMILQEILISKLGTALLPVMTPLSSIYTEGEEVLKIPSEDLNRVSFIEQKFILTKIILQYGKLKLNIAQAFSFAASLTNLFDELHYNLIPIDSIQNLSIIDHAEHWHTIYEFLHYAHTQWQQQLLSIKKADKSLYQISILNAEIARLRKDPSSSIIVAGILGYDTTSWSFLKEVADLARSSIILPPLPNYNNDILSSDEIGSSEPLYCLYMLLETLDKKLSDFTSLSESPDFLTSVDQLLLPQHASEIKFDRSSKNIQYIEFENIFEEAKALSIICSNNLHKRIAIILNNEKFKEFYTNCLDKNNIKYKDNFGVNLSKTRICSFIVSISELVCLEFSLINLFTMLKNPLINSENVSKLEQILLNNHRFVANFEEITAIIKKNDNNILLQWWLNLNEKLSSFDKTSNNFSYLITQIIVITEALCPNIWQQNHGLEISQFFSELITLEIEFLLENSADFPSTIKSLAANSRIYVKEIEFDKDCNVVICRPKDIILSKYDIVLLADFNENNWSSSRFVSPWLNRQMQEELKIFSNQIRISLSIYNFYLLLHNEKVIITRSLKQIGNANVTVSNFIIKLKHLARDIVVKIDGTNFLQNCSNTLNQEALTLSEIETLNIAVKSEIFPCRISVTDIETLIRCPYSFYSKKILNLRKVESFATAPKLSEFGSFVHKFIEQYTKAYNNIESDKLAYIRSIGKALLNNISLPVYTKKLWSTKFDIIASHFIQFDESRRYNGSTIYSEVKGEMKLKISDQEIIITAIADRIEIDPNNNATILDFKTGTVPFNKDVLSGLSPQLVLEALILLEGGFNINVQSIDKLIYVKISHSEPYIESNEINIDRLKLIEHKQGLIDLLSYYLLDKTFHTGVNFLKYNDYTHLARLI